MNDDGGDMSNSIDMTSISYVSDGPGRDFGAACDLTAACAASGEALALPEVLAGVRVLVIDDEPDLRELMSTILAASRAEVTAVGSAIEALGAMQREDPDVVVSDIGMPGQDGYELMRAIRARELQRGDRRVPAVAVTAYGSSKERQRALDAGFDIHVAKPFDPLDLVAILFRLVTWGSRP
jgi:CheY-like chemotaxis protein